MEETSLDACGGVEGPAQLRLNLLVDPWHRNEPKKYELTFWEVQYDQEVLSNFIVLFIQEDLTHFL